MSQKANPPAASAPEEDGRDKPVTLAMLRQLVNRDWRGLPGNLLIVLSGDTEGNRFSPFATYGHGRYEALDPHDAVGEAHPTPGQLAKSPSLRELYPDGIPDKAVPALVLYPLG
ncbi:hypothetical protein [Streptomyces minutiscleroticus]|uniref:hypothetical protein n=1 Tax=Streptomyces minutiscleroticus TaxID=68238 RepID=UPI00332AD710